MKINILDRFRKMLKLQKKQEPDSGAFQQKRKEKLPLSEANLTTPDNLDAPGSQNPPPSPSIIDAKLKKYDEPPGSLKTLKIPENPRPGKNISMRSARESLTKHRPVPFEEVRNHPDISASMQAIRDKYGLSEITLVTDDGLVLATSATRDVEFDAVHYSLAVLLSASPSEPDVKLFELNYKGSPLIGIIRSDRAVSPILKKQIRGDTKVILQWWL